jgi:hypothetical protein
MTGFALSPKLPERVNGFVGEVYEATPGIWYCWGEVVSRKSARGKPLSGNFTLYELVQLGERPKAAEVFERGNPLVARPYLKAVHREASLRRLHLIRNEYAHR